MGLIQHTGYARPRARLMAEMTAFRPGHVICLIGPSGGGKTTMRHSVMQEMFGNPVYWGQGRIPAIEVFAMLPNRAYFSSKELARSIANELHVPNLNWLFRDSQLDPEVVSRIQAQVRESAATWAHLGTRPRSEGDYWNQVQRGVPARDCKYISLDQVTALLVNHRDTSPADHALHLMALAESAGVMLVMTGVQSATRLWAIHSELRRRVTTVWVPPYSDKRRDDRIPFLKLLRSVSAKYPLSNKDLLLRLASDILAGTGGVFAEVVQLLDRAVVKMTEEGRSTLLKRHLDDAYYGDEDLTTLWRDIGEFERAMAAGDVRKRSALVSVRWALGDSPAEVTA